MREQSTALILYSPLERKLIRSELNLEHWITALFTTSKSQEKSRVVWREIEPGKRVGIMVGRRMHERKVRELGVLVVPDLKVFYALVKVWEDRGKPQEEIELLFTVFRQYLRKTKGGLNDEQILKSLESLKVIPIQWFKSFYQKDTDTWHTIRRRFEILSAYDIYEVSVRGNVKALAFKFKFHDRILRNLLAGYTKPKNLPVVLGLKHEIAVLLYSWLDLVMAKRTRLTIFTKVLFNQLHLKAERYRYLANRKEALLPVLDELQGMPVSTGILTTLQLDGAENEGDLLLTVHKRPFAPRLKRDPQIERLAYTLAKEVDDVESVVKEGQAVLQIKEKNRGFWLHLARQAINNERVQRLIRVAQTDTKMEYLAGNIKKGKVQFFVDWLQRLAQARGIDLGLKTKKPLN